MGIKTLSLEDALEMTGFGKYNLKIFSLCALIMVGMIFETLGLSFIIPAAQCDLELNLTQKGWLAAIPFIGIIATSHLWGWLADTRGRKPIIQWSITIGSILSITSSFCPNLISFALIRMLAALFIAGPTAVVYAYLGEFHTPRYRDRMVIFVSAFITFGTVLLPAIAWLIYPLDFRYPFEALGLVYRPWRLLVVLCALPYLICAILCFFAPESPKYLASAGKTDEAMTVIKSIYNGNKGKLDDPFMYTRLETIKPPEDNVGVLRSMWNQTVPLFKRPLLFYTFIACSVQFITFSNANGFYLWIPEILNRMIDEMQVLGDKGTICEMLASDTSLANSTLVGCIDTVHTETFMRSLILGAIYCPFPAIAALVVNALGKRNILIGVPFVCGLASIAIHWTTNENLSLILMAVMQIDAVCIGIMNAVVVEHIPTNLRAMAVSLALLTGRFGSIMGSNLIGYLLENNCAVCFFLYGGLLLRELTVTVWYSVDGACIVHGTKGLL